MMRVSIDTRFRVGALATVVVMLASNLMAYLGSHDIQLQLARHLETDEAIAHSMNHLDHAMHRLRTALLTGSPLHRIASHTALDGDLGGIERALADIPRRIPALATPARQLSPLVRHLRDARDELMRRGDELLTATVEHRQAITQRVQALELGMCEDLAEIARFRWQFATLERQSLRRAIKESQSRLGLQIMLAFIAMVALTVFFSGQIKMPVHRLLAVISRFAAGETRLNLRQFGTEEFDEVLKALDGLGERIEDWQRLRLEKIELERHRFKALANRCDFPIAIVNAEQQIAFASNAWLSWFHVTWDELYEKPLAETPLPRTFRETLLELIVKRDWTENRPIEPDGGRASVPARLTLVPVRVEGRKEVGSVIAILRPVSPSPGIDGDGGPALPDAPPSSPETPHTPE